MSRHRNVRSMNYSDEYDGYDDIYGHSVEDDYSISPSDAAEFMYDRTRQPQMSAFFNEGDDIVEEDETETESEPQRRDSTNYKWPRLSDVDEARLRSCLEEIRNVVGDCVPEHVLVESVLKSGFDVQQALDQALKYSQAATVSPTSGAAGDDPKPQRQRRERNREKDCDESSPNYFLDDMLMIPSVKSSKKSLATLHIRNNIGGISNSNIFGVNDSALLNFSYRHESLPSSTKTSKNNSFKSVSTKNNLGNIEHVLNQLNSFAKRDNSKLPVECKFHCKNAIAHDSQESFDNFVASQESRQPFTLSIPKFQMKIRRDSDKENDQEFLQPPLKMESNIEELSPPLSDDDDSGGFSSLSALAKQHQKADSEKSQGIPFKNFNSSGGSFVLKGGQRPLEGSEKVDGGGSEEKCFSTLADLIASHLNTSDGSRYLPNKSSTFPSFHNTSLNASGSDSGSCSPARESDVVIDLTCALKSNATKLLQDDVTSICEDTPPVFLDFGESENHPALPEARHLSCSMTASDLLQQIFVLRESEPSSFGKILCKKWRRLPVPKVLHRMRSLHTIKHFTFNSLSPDDENLKNRRRM